MAGACSFQFATEVAPPAIIPFEKLKVSKVLETIEEDDAGPIIMDNVVDDDLNCYKLN